MRLLLIGIAAVLLLSACAPPLGLGLPTTRELENGAIASLASARSLEVAGSYLDAGNPWEIDLQIARTGARHVVAVSPDIHLEAILIDKDGYFRSQDLLTQQLNGDPASRSLATAAGNAWWKGLVGSAPTLPDFVNGDRARTTFINADLVSRRDNVADGGVQTAELSGPRVDVYISEAAPHQLVHLHMQPGTTVDGVTRADLRFSHYGADFNIVPPPSVINFADLSTLPPNYSVLSVDTSGCGSPCLLQAVVKNLGGKTGARAPSTVTFDMTDLASGASSGSCTATIAPDVGYTATTTVSCTVSGVDFGAAKVTATPTNPGHG
jgi:hypothetical protein